MKARYAQILSASSLIIMLSGFTPRGNFPAPVKEPAAAFYINLSSSGIFGELAESQKACHEIASAVYDICKFRDASGSLNGNSDQYKALSLSFLQDCIINGFLKIEELYFYYRDSNDYALIANGDFDLQLLSEKTKADKLYDDENNLIQISSSISQKFIDTDKNNNGLFLQINSKRLLICPENASENIIESLQRDNNQLGEGFKTFEQMVKIKPAIGAEINIKQLFENKYLSNIPKPVASTKLIRLIVAAQQNKLQISVPLEEDREKLKKDLFNQTAFLNRIFDNKTDYKLTEGKTSIFIETVANKEQMQSISRKATAFMLHFFIKNTASNQL